MPHKIIAALVEAIHVHTPEHTNPAAVVADTLSLSREAAYRRLRGEVAFTFDEAVLLAAKLNFSLDRIISGTSGNMLFNLKFSDFQSPLEVYIKLLDRDARFFRETASAPTAVFAMATNTVPAEFYLRYEHLANFKLFKWLYQHGLNNPQMTTFEQMLFPEALLRSYRDYVAAVQLVPTTNYVFDDSGFAHWINAIQSFKAMRLLSDQSVYLLQDELFRMLDDLEKIAISGGYENGHKVSFYLSDVDIDAAYSYVSTDHYNATGIEIFSLNALRTSDAAMFEYMRRWIQTQSRFSTLISHSGEVRRIQFFTRQRELIGQLV